jgi:uncharacterized protein YbjT (DUF2867 family)
MRVRALVRPDSGTKHLSQLAVEAVTGDLLRPDTLATACKGVDYIIATANAAIPRKPLDRFETVDAKGYRDLIDAARQSGVRQFIYTSVTSAKHESGVPLFRVKRATEKYLAASGLDYTILRAPAFMDIAFAMMGSDIPLRGAETPTMARPFWFTSNFYRKIQNNIASGKAAVPGDGITRHSFIAVNDVAEFLVRFAGSPVARNKIFEVGGPEPLSPRDVVSIYEQVLGKKVKVSTTPALIFRTAAALLRPLSPAAANIMALNYLTATEDGIVPGAAETAAQFGVQLTTAERFLRMKLQQSAGEDD